MPQRLRDLLIRLLRSAERFTKTDMVYAASGGFWTTWSQAVTVLCSIPLSIAFANLLDPHDYGVYRYVLTVAAILGALSLTGLPLMLTRAVARGFEGSLATAFKLNLRWSVFVVAGACIGAGYYALQANYVLAGAMILIGIFSPLLTSGSLFSAFLNGKHLFRLNAQYGNRRTVIHTLAILATIFVYPEPLAILITYFASQALTALYYYRKTVRTVEKDLAIDPEMAHVSKHLSFLNIFTTLTDKLDALLLFQFVGAVELAVYAFAEMVPDVFNRFSKNISLLAFSKFATRGTSKGLWLKTFLLSLALLPAVLLYIMFAPYIFSLFFPAYMESVPFTQALALLALVSASLPSAYLDAQADIRARYILAVTSNVVKLVSVIIGVLLFGIWGAIAGRYLSRIVGIVIVYGILRRYP